MDISKVINFHVNAAMISFTVSQVVNELVSPSSK